MRISRRGTWTTLVFVQELAPSKIRKSRENQFATRTTPPAMITPRLTNEPVPANKFVWVLHPDYENAVVAQGRSGVAWKSKSKLAAGLCIGEQLVQIHRVFTKNVPALCNVAGNELKMLEDGLPPSCGRHKFLRWDTRFLAAFNP